MQSWISISTLFKWSNLHLKKWKAVYSEVRLSCSTHKHWTWHFVVSHVQCHDNGDVMFLSVHYYRSQRSCGKVMFSQVFVILFTGEGVWQTPLGRHPWADTLGQTPPEQTPPGQTSPRQTPPRADTPPQQMATAADGTHPTGMHSCLFILWATHPPSFVLCFYLKGTSCCAEAGFSEKICAFEFKSQFKTETGAPTGANLVQFRQLWLSGHLILCF